jgi:hypothetical protein
MNAPSVVPCSELLAAANLRLRHDNFAIPE